VSSGSGIPTERCAKDRKVFSLVHGDSHHVPSGRCGDVTVYITN
jgi:hypothetical protein